MRKKRLISTILAALTVMNFLTVGARSVQAVENENLALNKAVVASSEENGSYSASKITDGDLKTRWATGENKAKDEWIEINLENEKKIEEIAINFERTDNDQNILSYKIEVERDGVYEEVYKKQERAKQLEKITFEEDVIGSKVKITILNADGGTLNWLNVGINEVQIYGEEINSTIDTNHVLNATMSASSVEEDENYKEIDYLMPNKTNDGSKETRWAGDYTEASNQWLKATFTEATKVKKIKLTFHTRDVAPLASNIEQFSIKYTDQNGETKYAVQDFKNTALEDGWSTEVSILLDEAIIAKDITICDFVANSKEYNNISIVEVEAYSNDVDAVKTLDEVVNSIKGGTIEKGAEFPMPKVPKEFEIKINGADFQQVIGDDGTIVTPLTDKNVKVSFEVTEKSTGNSVVTNDYNYLVKGQYTQDEANNSKPVVIPEIAEWYSDSNEALEIKSIETVVYNNDALETVVDEFISDYKDFTGVELKKEKGEAKANAFNFSLEAPDKLLGNEGYTMDIQKDRVVVKSESTTGNMYGMQTILQMYKENNNSFNVGTMRDYPRFEVRGFLFDIARKPVSMEMIKDVSRTMRYYKMNDLQLHLSDNYIFLEDYGKLENEEEAFKAYEAFRLESGLTNDKGESPTAKDYSISKKDFKELILNERSLGMNIVPEIDVPAHATSFTKIWPEIMVENGVSGNRPLIDHIDISKDEAVDKVKEIFDDYTKGENPTFDSETIVHIGADEFISNPTAYREFINEIVPHIKETNTVRMWGGLTYINDNKTEISKEAIENVEMNLWASSWADGVEMYDMGYKLINTIDDFGYMVPSGSLVRSNAYGDLLNVERIFNEFEANRVRLKNGSYTNLPSGDDQVLGAAFALWSDNIDKKASGLSESDLYWRFFDAMSIYAEKTWAATGKEKGSSEELLKLAELKGTGPNTNPYYQENKVGDIYQSFDFEKGLEDTSENNRDLTEGTAKVEEGKLVLSEDTSYVTSAIDKLGNNNELSFDITLNSEATPGDILFEADSPYGTHDIRIMEDGSLGFTRELYNYYFNYKLPVGETVNIKITTEQQKTTLYVNDELVSEATGKFIHNDMVKKENISYSTFALPLERIGSKTNAIDASIDNVKVAESK